jgi:hypothetical protein
VDGKVLVNIIKGNDPQMMMPTGMGFMTSGSQNTQKWRVRIAALKWYIY